MQNDNASSSHEQNETAVATLTDVAEIPLEIINEPQPQEGSQVNEGLQVNESPQVNEVKSGDLEECKAIYEALTSDMLHDVPTILLHIMQLIEKMYKDKSGVIKKRIAITVLSDVIQRNHHVSDSVKSAYKVMEGSGLVEMMIDKFVEVSKAKWNLNVTSISMSDVKESCSCTNKCSIM